MREENIEFKVILIKEELEMIERKLQRDDIPEWQRRYLEERKKELSALKRIYEEYYLGKKL
jgi:hypothetical protein